MNKLLFCAALFGSALSVQADVLFHTDFHTTPAGFKAASDVATAKGGDDTLVVGPNDTVIDLCTLSTPKAATAITISKGSQTCVKVGDTTGCTPGRLSLKNSGCSITTPTVTGPCAITYYAASSSTTGPGRGVSCLVNGTDIPDADIPELWLNGTQQASRKMVYNYTTAGPVDFTLSAVGGGIYIYDINIVSGSVSGVTNLNTVRHIQGMQISGNLIKNDKNAIVDIYAISGAKLLSSNKSTIDLHGFTHGVYMVRMEGMNEQIKIVR